MDIDTETDPKNRSRRNKSTQQWKQEQLAEAFESLNKEISSLRKVKDLEYNDLERIVSESVDTDTEIFQLFLKATGKTDDFEAFKAQVKQNYMTKLNAEIDTENALEKEQKEEDIEDYKAMIEGQDFVL